MAKGDDALARKRNRVRRKRLRSSENAVSARVAAIIANKRRRKSGKRRGCEGMCFSLPTPEDPFNERHGKKRKGEEPTNDTEEYAAAAAAKDDKPKKDANTKKQPPEKAGAKAKLKAVRERATETEEGRVDFDRPSKFLVVCLNAIRDAVAPEDDGGSSIHGAGDWGVELWRSCSAPAPSDVLDTSGACSTMEQTAWLVSTACDIVARKERLGMVVSCPFLLYLVPSQEKAAQVRSICKPLKPLGIHSVSLHPGASVEHQISGLKTCEPEFLIATPERLLELVSLKAIDISNVSMLVIDGLKYFVDLNVSDKIFSIRDTISSSPQITIFTDSSDKNVATMAKTLLRGRITKICINDSVPSRSAFVTQHVHFCPSEKLKTSKVKEILEQITKSHAKKSSKILLVAASDKKAQDLSSSLKLGNCIVTDGSHKTAFTICSSSSSKRRSLGEPFSRQIRLKSSDMPESSQNGSASEISEIQDYDKAMGELINKVDDGTYVIAGQCLQDPKILQSYSHMPTIERKISFLHGTWRLMYEPKCVLENLQPADQLFVRSPNS